MLTVNVGKSHGNLLWLLELDLSKKKKNVRVRRRNINRGIIKKESCKVMRNWSHSLSEGDEIVLDLRSFNL